jgi:hypothetical protein
MPKASRQLPESDTFSRRFVSRGWSRVHVPAYLLVGCAFLHDRLMPSTTPWFFGSILALGGVSIAWMVALTVYQRRVRRRLTSCGWTLCPGCGYDLSQHSKLPSETVGAREALPCPECGRLSRLVRVREAWKEEFP